MARNYVQPGKVVTLTTPSGGVKSGDGFLSGSLFGIAQFDADQATPVEAALTGVWSLPKPGSVVAFSEGEKVFWDASASQSKKTAAGYWPIGAAIVAAQATDSVVIVRLDGHSLTAVPAP